ncbi:MAG: hypothetical protein WDO70_11300 [Alphaproteobacteria bacterium]
MGFTRAMSQANHIAPPGQHVTPAYNRQYVIYGHADATEQAKERALLEEKLGEAKTTQDGFAVQKIEFKLSNLGRLVSLETFQRLEGSLSKRWQVKPTCQACGEEVFVRGTTSLKVKRAYFHAAEDKKTQPKERCPLRANLDVRHFVDGGPSVDMSEQNRRQFYQPEVVAKFLQVAKNILGRDYKPYIPEKILERADELKIWGQIHDPLTAPFQLLALDGNVFNVTLPGGTRSQISFMLNQRYTADDRNNGNPDPGDIRMYAHFSQPIRQGSSKLYKIPGLRREWLSARREITNQIDLFEGPSPANPSGHYGKTAGQEYIVVSRDTAEKLSRLNYAGVSAAMSHNENVPEIMRSLVTHTDAIIAKYGNPEPTPPRRKNNRAAATNSLPSNS